MELNFNQVKAITDTLPIGFYTERKIPTELKEDSPSSSYNPYQDTIEISYPQIINGIDKVNNMKLAETIIRSNFYHEISHAILTPKDIRPTDIINIFEDERIETILKDFYWGVDFKDTVKKITNYEKDHTPENALEAFFNLVRYREGLPEHLKEVERIIEENKHLNRKSYGGISHYTSQIQQLYNNLVAIYGNPETKKDYINQMFDLIESDKNGEGEGLTDKKGKMDSDKTEKGKNQIDTEQEREKMKEYLSSLVNDLFNGKFHNDLLTLFQNFNRKNSKGSSLQTYSGIINPRLVGREDYRIFERSSNMRGNNQFGSLHLNLFIDVSGSFRGNIKTTNTIINSLLMIEKTNPNFTFDIVEMEVGEIILPKEKRFVEARGGNHLSKDIFDIYRKLQLPQQYNYNIALFDGDAYSNDCDYYRFPSHKKITSKGQGFSAFANNNCTIISDSDNECYISKYAPNTRTIYTTDYCGELLDNILKVMQKALS